MKYTLSKCPLCGAECHSAPKYRDGLDIVQCAYCSLVFLRTRDSCETTRAYYQGYASRAGSHMRLPLTLDEAHRSGLRRDYFMRWLLKHTKAEGKLIDVGGGWGAFANHAREKGFDPAVVELCEEAAHYAQETLGIPAYSRDIETLGFADESVQVVVALHTLEHLHDPDHALATIHHILKPGGLFCGIVPNIESLSSEMLLEKWLWLDPENHLTYFAPRTLEKHLVVRNFAKLELFTQTGDFALENIRPAAEKALGYALSGPELEHQARMANEAGLGEEIVFFFRRS